MTINSTILHLLLASAAAHNANDEKSPAQIVNSSLVIDIERGLHQRWEFRNFVFYISEHLYRDTHIAFVFFNEFWQRLPMAAVTIIKDNPNRMSGFLGTPCLCFIMTTGYQDPIMQLASESLQGLKYYKTMFVLFTLEEDVKELEERIRLLYEWVWHQRFLNTLLMTINNNIFLYEPFPIGKVVNISDVWQLKDFFRNDKLDLKGFEIKTPVRFDLPAVFCLTRFPNKGRHSKLTGSSGKIFGAFMNHINATFNDTFLYRQELEAFDIRDIIVMVQKQQLEISTHSYTSMRDDRVGTSYPVGINDLCLMVPFRNRTPEHLYLQMSFRHDSWLLLCFAAFYITLGLWLCSPPKDKDVSLSFLQSLCSLLLLTPLKLITLPLIRLRFIFVLLFVFGFCITNLYLSKMASQLTAIKSQEQINTIQEVVNAKLPIMMLDFEYEYLLEKNYTPGFLNLIEPVSKSIMAKHRDCLNTSYGYSVASNTWAFLNKQQRYLRKPLFRLTSICIGPFYHVFPLQKDSYLMQPLKDFILSISQTGYIFFWEDETFDDALFLGYVQMFKNDQSVKALSMDFFRSIIYVWLLGLLLASFTFVLELRRISLPTIYKRLANWFNWLQGKIYEM
ncbi:uncharacterized protein LOC124421044 [Lucilia cuprina]|uniref:uncharacterized protein LOC124421044 n=1 Tax=Lucilia cuprina TaxID=7375 RepID=UPI001F070F3D|nr:uncharacterized protein LOC124421044 [Lucilia cuprina]